MASNDLLNTFDREARCEYKGRNYLVRDNGSILRLPKDVQHPSKYDNVWTFGTKDPRTGYMLLSGNVRVHQVVCTAFNGAEPEDNMVVDHIDTNRCNNRPENLRWLTRLENVLFNEATRKKVIFLCGSIEAFIENPAIIRDKALPPNISWMKTVTKGQAAACKKHMNEWSKTVSKSDTSGKGISDWMFEETKESGNGFGEPWDNSYESLNSIERRDAYQRQQKEEEIESLEMLRQQILEEENIPKESLTPGAKQVRWKTPTEFPLCPQGDAPRTLLAYLDNLVKGKTFSKTRYGNVGKVVETEYNSKEEAVYVLTEDKGGLKCWYLAKITLQEGFFIHSSEGSFFEKRGALKQLTLAMGREWDGGDVFDDHCR